MEKEQRQWKLSEENLMKEDRQPEQVIIIGASGHGKVIADIVIQTGDCVKGFLDDADNLPDTIEGIPVLGKISSYNKYNNCKFIVAIGNALIRKRIVNELKDARWYTAIHPSAQISCLGVTIGEGTVVMAQAVINSCATIGRHCIINSGAVVEHDNVLNDYVHVSPGAVLAGTVNVGANTHIGAGVVVRNNINITSDCTIGAGAVVVRNIVEQGTYAGIPARMLLRKENENINYSKQ